MLSRTAGPDETGRFCFSQRALLAFRAISCRRAGESFCSRPFALRRPSSTAAGSFSFKMVPLNLNAQDSRGASHEERTDGWGNLQEDETQEVFLEPRLGCEVESCDQNSSHAAI
jgi:hypothetical protein